MKSSSCLKFLLVTAVLAMVFVSAGSAAVTEPSCDVSLTLTPSTLMPGETGQLVVVLTNTGSTPLTIYKVAITDSWDVVSVTHPALKTLGSIGVGKSMTASAPFFIAISARFHFERHAHSPLCTKLPLITQTMKCAPASRTFLI